MAKFHDDDDQEDGNDFSGQSGLKESLDDLCGRVQSTVQHVFTIFYWWCVYNVRSQYFTGVFIIFYCTLCTIFFMVLFYWCCVYNVYSHYFTWVLIVFYSTLCTIYFIILFTYHSQWVSSSFLCSQPEERFKAKTKFDSIRKDMEQCIENMVQFKEGTHNVAEI